MTSTAPGRASLAATTGESIAIDFEAEYRSATPGSSAWSIIAKHIRVSLVVPAERASPRLVIAKLLARTADPSAFVDQHVLLQHSTNKLFSGTAVYPLLIRSGESGRERSYEQKVAFVPFYDYYDENKFDEWQEMLIDPINQTTRFQVNLFYASAYSRTDQGVWHTVGS